MTSSERETDPVELRDDDLGCVVGGTGTPPTSLGGLSLPSSDTSIADLLLQQAIERSSFADGAVKQQLHTMQDRNDWLKEANSALASLHGERPTSAGATADYGSFIDRSGQTVSTEAWLEKNNVVVADDRNDGIATQSEFDATISNLKNSIDKISSQSQLDLARLQGLVNKSDQAAGVTYNLSHHS